MSDLGRSGASLRDPLLCRLGLHRYHHVRREYPPGAIPERGGIPSNPFSIERTEYRCRGCFKLHPREERRRA